MAKDERKTPQAERYGGPGSSHQDRTRPDDATGHKGGGERAGTAPAAGEPTNPDRSRVSGGGGERDRHHTHDPAEKA